MSAISGSSRTPARDDDARLVRSRAAVIDAARSLFLSKGCAGTTIEEIAAAAGLTKRTVYNNHGDKDALFRRIVADVIDYADGFAAQLREEFDGVTAETLEAALGDFACRLALGILRPEVIALRRLLIGEARGFPELSADYYARVPGRVIAALAERLAHLGRIGLLEVPDPRAAAGQFAYLAVGEPLDRAMLIGAPPSAEELTANARDGVCTFLARYSA